MVGLQKIINPKVVDGENVKNNYENHSFKGR
jgi:hypothetical protein